MNDKGKKNFVRKVYRLMRMDNCLKKKKYVIWNYFTCFVYNDG